MKVFELPYRSQILARRVQNRTCRWRTLAQGRYIDIWPEQCSRLAIGMSALMLVKSDGTAFFALRKNPDQNIALDQIPQVIETSVRSEILTARRLFPDKYEGILSLTRMPDDNDLIPFIESKVADGSFQESTIHGLLIHRPGDSPQYTVELTTADEVLNALNP